MSNANEWPRVTPRRGGIRIAGASILRNYDRARSWQPKFVPVAGGKAVFEWDANRRALIVTTILDADMSV
jgi:hypothetical protein